MLSTILFLHVSAVASLGQLGGAQSNAQGASLLGRAEGMLSQEILKIRLSENVFLGF